MAVEISILIPALFERPAVLATELLQQVQDKPVEVLVLTDNRRRSTGLKRQALLDVAAGDYVVHLDDDDWVAPTFIADLLAATHHGADVISYDQEVDWNGENSFRVTCGLTHDNEGMHKKDELWQPIKRKPWHWCCWAARIAKQARFPDGYIDDDWFWLKQVIELAKTEHHLDKILHYYRYRSGVSASQQGKPTT